MTKVLDRYGRWMANMELLKATEPADMDNRHQFWHLLILELQGEIGAAAFSRCLKTATKQLNEDNARAAARYVSAPETKQ